MNFVGEIWIEFVVWGVLIVWVYFLYKVMVKVFKIIVFVCGKENKKFWFFY